MNKLLCVVCNADALYILMGKSLCTEHFKTHQSLDKITYKPRKSSQRTTYGAGL